MPVEETCIPMRSNRLTWFGMAMMPLLFNISSAFGQGSLTPPGAPGPLFKTLNQIEPRTPLSNEPVTITVSGSYYLTTNFSAEFAPGITIATHGVTIDLNGFAVDGAGMRFNGILVSGNRTNI